MSKKPYRTLPHVVREAAQDLVTIRDFMRYAVTRFHAADIHFGHGTDNAMNEAAFMILEMLKLPIDTLEPWLDCRLTESERKALDALIFDRVTRRVPASYLLNRAYIQGRPFYVDERVIIPRSFIGEIIMGDNNPADEIRKVESVLDLCTGSGCLAILAAELYPDAVIDAVDLSADALAVAAINVREHDVADRVNILQGDLFAPVDGRQYDLIICNPPYVDQQGMDILSQEHRKEPAIAFIGGGTDGMNIVRDIIRTAPAHLNPGGAMICEVGRGRNAIMVQFPDLPFRWLDTVHGEGEVFWITREQLLAAMKPAT